MKVLKGCRVGALNPQSLIARAILVWRTFALYVVLSGAEFIEPRCSQRALPGDSPENSEYTPSTEDAYAQDRRSIVFLISLAVPRRRDGFKRRDIVFDSPGWRTD